ncbi:Exportin-4 [Borealophlyctis nickersoniae]|nr:Exportin-4 [Borealophlyctis nickersoniae]
MELATVYAQFEQLCADFMSPEKRLAAEQTQNSLCRFHAAGAIKEAIAREYNLHPKAEIHALRDWLIAYVLRWTDRLEHYVLQSLLQAVAVIVKRGWLDESVEDRESLFQKVTELLSGPVQQEGELRRVFGLILQISHAIVHDPTKAASAEVRPLLASSIAAAETVLSWDFATADDNALNDSESKGGVSTSPFPSSWRDIVIRPDVLDMFFHLHHLMQSSETLSNRTRQCLIQLAGMNGPVFQVVDGQGKLVDDVLAQKAYVGHLLQGWLKMLAYYQNTDPYDGEVESGAELVGIVGIARQILQTFDLAILGALPEFLHFLNELGKLTDTNYRNFVNNEDEFTTEAADLLLEVWASLVQQTECFMEEYMATPPPPEFDFASYISFLTGLAYHIFETYTGVRLKLTESDEDFEDGGFKDQELYADQLIYVATLARMNAAKSISGLQALLDDRFLRLQRIFEAKEPTDAKVTKVLLEHAHWLALLAGHVLADSGRGERPSIPPAIMSFSAKSGAEDPVVTLSTGFLKLLDLLSIEPNSALFDMTSPLTNETLFWFVERWSKTYLFVDRHHAQISESMVRAFGQMGGGPGILDFILDKIKRNVILWHGDSDVLLEIVKLLNTFATIDVIRDAILVTEQFEQLVTLFMQSLGKIPASVHSPLIEAIASIATHASTPALRSHYFQRLSETIEKRLLAVLGRPDFAQVYQTPAVVEEVQSTMEMYSGLAMAADESNTKAVYEVCSRRFSDFVKLLDVYRNVAEVEGYILSVFNNLVRCQSFDELSQEECQTLYLSVIELLKTYAKNEVGRKRVRNDGDEPYEDLSNMLELLAEMMASQYEGLMWEDVVEKRANKSPSTVDVADVVFYGINIVIPLVTDQMLKFPDLCKDYISLVTNLIKYFPDKLSTLPPELLASLVKSLDFGMDHSIPEVGRSAFEAVTSLALFAWDEQQAKGEASVAFLAPHLDHLMLKTLDLMMYRTLDGALVESAGEAAFSLAIARRTQYATLMQQIHDGLESPIFQARFTAALTNFTAGLEKLLHAQGPTGKLRMARVDGMLRGVEVDEWREVVRRFLVDVRGFLRVK